VQPLVPALQMFMGLLLAHAVADTILQPKWIELHKHRSDAPSTWPIGLGTHGLIHGTFVAAITGSIMLGVAEMAVHAITDFGKGEGWYGTYADQAIHVTSKVIWVLLALSTKASII
jgi:hypothetical protein